MKVGRNDLCPCGSGKKYKHCHLPIDEAREASQRRMRRAQDTLMPKIMEAAQQFPNALPPAIERYWKGKYTTQDMTRIDELEDRGAERFLTWFAFDYPLEDGRTLVERLIAGEDSPEFSEDERALLATWGDVRLRPYTIESAVKGKTIQLRDMLGGETYNINDHVASRRVEPGEVLVFHLVPVGEEQYIGGSAAHLTEDTREKLREFADIHLEAYQRDHPGTTWVDLLRDRSEVLNHFVMDLPVEAPDPNILDNIVAQARASLLLAGESVGLRKSPGEDDEDSNDSSDEPVPVGADLPASPETLDELEEQAPKSDPGI